jgi:DNA-binding response OmpR family regulator
MKILIVEDEPMLLAFLESAFTEREHEVRAFVSAARALEVILGWPPDVLLCDLDLGCGHAEDLAWVVARIPADRTPRARIILMSAELKRLARSRRAADALLLKPFAADELMSVVEASA